MTIRDHMPDVVFILWLMTGQYYYLEKLQMQADRVGESREASGNPSVSGNFSSTTPSQPSGGIPPTLGWYQIPNTRLAPQCPNDPTIQGATGCAAVISTWSGGMADTTRNRLIIWGGGHNDYYGNEVYALDLNSLSMKRIINPSPFSPCTEATSDGKPNSRHTYGGLSYLAHADRMYVFGGGPACTRGGGTDATWTLDLASLQWRRMDPTKGGHPDGSYAISAAAYDPNTKKVIVSNAQQLWMYDYDANRYTQLNTNVPVTNGAAVIDPKRKMFFLIGGGVVRAFDISRGSNYAMNTWDRSVRGCSGLVGAGEPGLAYDPVQDRIVGWAGGDTVYLFNPDTKSCTTQAFSGGPGPQQGNGTYGRWQFFPALGVFIIVNDWQQNAYSLRMTPPSGSTQARPPVR